jgi:hypothetical protein
VVGPPFEILRTFLEEEAQVVVHEKRRRVFAVLGVEYEACSVF